MSYRLTTKEPLAVGLRRLAREQLEGALREMSQVQKGEEAAAVHATRKHIKKARALLRLIRDQIGPEIFQEENHRLRDVAGAFSGSRDARVQLELLEKLRQGAEQKRTAFAGTRALLEKEIAAYADSFGPRRKEAAATLQRVCDRLEGWPLDELEMAHLCCGLRHSYHRARKCLKCVREDATAENFHSWRKRVKDIWYQARILQCLNQPVICQLAQTAKTLGQQLGDLHDLAFFREWLETAPEVPEDERSLLLGLICAGETETAMVALDLGARFFAEKPGAFERRLLRYAKAWPEVLA